MILLITKLPAKRLRKETKPLNFPLRKVDHRLIKNMVSTCRAANGVGLAAPQVSHDWQLAIIYLADLYFFYNLEPLDSSFFKCLFL